MMAWGQTASLISAKQAYEIRNKLGHKDIGPPRETSVANVIAGAEEFAALVRKAVERLALPSSPSERVDFVRAQLQRIDDSVAVISTHYPPKRADKIGAEIGALRGILSVDLPESAVEPVMILFREYQNALDQLVSEMYRVCPQCGGSMEEKTWYTSSGGTEDDPEPTSVTCNWAIMCARCGHSIESESFGV